MLDRGHHLSLGGALAGQLVRDHHTRGPALLFQQLAEQTLGGPLVAPALDQNVEHNPILVDGPPQPVLLAADHQAHFVEVPFVARAWQLAGELGQGGWLPFLRVKVPPTEESSGCCSHIQRWEGRPTRRKPGCKSPRWARETWSDPSRGASNLTGRSKREPVKPRKSGPA